MSLPQGGHARLDNTWLTEFIRDLPTADAICLYLQSRGNLRRRGADLGELISALGPRDLRTVERTVKSLLAHARIVREGAHYYAPAFAPASSPAPLPGNPPGAVPGNSPANSSNAQEGDMRQDGKNGDNSALEEEKEEKKGIHTERESKQVGGEDPPPHSLSGERGEEAGTAGGAPGAEAPDGAGGRPARPFIVPFTPPANAGNTRPTSTENVPPGAADGGGPPSGATRAALEIAFGPVFLAQLLGEGEKRQRWLTLEAGRVAELHQSALESSGPRPWRTLFISQLDLEVAQGGKGKRRQDLTREEWLAR